MTSSQPSLADRFSGCLLGLALGDALGAHFEGRTAEHIRRYYRSPQELIDSPPPGELQYTDDTQMSIGLTETLIAHGVIDHAALCGRFGANYQPWRGYGGGARRVLQAMIDGDDHDWLAANYFPGGSFGNGAAMRVAPIGIYFRDDLDLAWEQARLSALPTHVHPLGIEGAQLLAVAVALASAADPFDKTAFLGELARRATSAEYSGPLRRAATIENAQDLGLFGTGVDAPSSVVTAIACFGLTPHSYSETIGTAILLGGDTDTIAAMAGAISGAHLGHGAIPQHLLEKLEDDYQGRTYLGQLSRQLFDRYRNGLPKDRTIDHSS